MRFITLAKLQNVEVESDSLLVVNICNMQSSIIPWEIRAIVEEIHILKNRLQNCNIRFLPRDANSVADWLSKNVASVFCEGIMSRVPEELSHLLVVDVNSYSK